MQRVIQFWRAINAHLSGSDFDFINIYLNKKEQNLFFAMRLYDQRHVLNVAYTARRLTQKDSANINEKLLMKACLLHDVGRTAKDIFLFDKVFAVLLDKYLPKTAHKLAKYNNSRNRSFWKKRRHALFIYYHHAAIGAEKLQKIKLYDIAEIIKYHHAPPKYGDCRELIILRKADSLN
ncbi:HD domain-containing protein [Megamonas hypermegale]|uniref:HD domain-containing protein n=1 Tax=Megamonas hypermegale TaxID=158847 RepID=UPI0026EBD4A9|nr:HD domain-containing protein [Megamonas hypermegale]